MTGKITAFKTKQHGRAAYLKYNFIVGFIYRVTVCILYKNLYMRKVFFAWAKTGSVCGCKKRSCFLTCNELTGLYFLSIIKSFYHQFTCFVGNDPE